MTESSDAQNSTTATRPQFYEPATLIDRLHGIYRIPIRDGLGATGGGDEPDNPDEYVRSFQTPSIQREAAREIGRLRAQIDQLKHALSEVKLAIEMTAPDVVWTRQACPETACDFIARTLEEVNDVAF